MAKAFVDTNVFLYAFDARDRMKQQRARELLANLESTGQGVVSTQVVTEFANNAVKKLRLSPELTVVACEIFSPFTTAKVDLAIVASALALMPAASISFWDACIVAAANQAKCRLLFTEDLQPGQRFGDLRVANPFA